jgi:hypothetical protein
MPSLADVRSQYPQYNDMSDGQLADALYRKFYSDMDRTTFDQKVGLKAAPVVETPRGEERGGLALRSFEGGMAAGAQQTTPDMEAHRGSYLGRATTNELDEEMYIDAQGVPQPTDKNKHVVLTDLSDGVRKVFARSAKTDEGPLEGISRILAPGLATGPVTMRAAKGAATFVPKPAAEVPSAAQLEKSYRDTLYGPVVSGAKLKPEASNRVVDQVTDRLNADLYDPEFPAFKTVRRLQTDAPTEDALRRQFDPTYNFKPGAPKSFHDVEIARQRLSEGSKGIPGADKSASGRAAGYIDEALAGFTQADAATGDIPAAQKAMEGAREEYRAAQLAKALDKRLHRADLKADITGGDSVGTKLKSSVEQFLASPDARGIPQGQRDILEKFVRGTAGERTAEWVANKMRGLYGVGAGVLTGDLSGAAIPAAGIGINRLMGRITTKQADKLSELFRTNTPLGRRMASQLDDWNKTVEEAHTKPTARNVSRLIIATRNLSNNLKDADIAISPNELLRSIQGTSPAKTEEE